MTKLCMCSGCQLTRSGVGYQPCSNMNTLKSPKKAVKKDPLEKAVEKYLHKSIVAIGGTTFKFASDNLRGVTDRIIILNGRVIFVEVKRVKGKLSPLQISFADKILSHNCDCVCVYGHMGVDKLIELLKRDPTLKLKGDFK